MFLAIFAAHHYDTVIRAGFWCKSGRAYVHGYSSDRARASIKIGHSNSLSSSVLESALPSRNYSLGLAESMKSPAFYADDRVSRSRV